MRFFFSGFIVLCLVFSCSPKNTSQIDVSDIKVDFSIDRYEVDFYNASPKSLKKLKEKYPYLFPKAFTDSLALVKMKDANEQELFAESQKVFQDFTDVATNLVQLFKHVKYYNTSFKAPNVVTMLTNIDYENRVIYADSLLLISLDAYLGKTHRFYSDYPNYIKQNNTKEHIVVDVAKALIDTQIPPLQKRSFIEKMIFEGKKMYVVNAYLPFVKEHHKVGYTKEKLLWAKANEVQIWSYFIEKKLLFSTDTKLNMRFLENAPFSKFYMAQDHLSPGKIGVWLGWQIVNSFMQNNDVSLQELINLDENFIYKNSKYKPKK